MEARLGEILETFERGVPGVRGAAIADREGLPIANGFREPLDLMAVTAMSTLTIQSSRTVFERLGLRAPKQITIEGEAGKVVVMELGAGAASLIALVNPETNVGLLKLEMAAAARRLEEALGLAAAGTARVEEVFLLAHSGLLIGHASATGDVTWDQDIMAGMLSAVQSFVRDAFRVRGGDLKELKMAHIRVRLFQGAWVTLAVVASGPIGDAFLTHAKDALVAWEQENDAALDVWNGDMDAFRGLDGFLADLMHFPVG